MTGKEESVDYVIEGTTAMTSWGKSESYLIDVPAVVSRNHDVVGNLADDVQLFDGHLHGSTATGAGRGEGEGLHELREEQTTWRKGNRRGLFVHPVARLGIQL